MDWTEILAYVCFSLGACLLVLSIGLIIYFVIFRARRAKKAASAVERAAHLKNYHQNIYTLTPRTSPTPWPPPHTYPAAYLTSKPLFWPTVGEPSYIPRNEVASTPYAYDHHSYRADEEDEDAGTGAGTVSSRVTLSVRGEGWAGRGRNSPASSTTGLSGPGATPVGQEGMALSTLGQFGPATAAGPETTESTLDVGTGLNGTGRGRGLYDDGPLSNVVDDVNTDHANRSTLNNSDNNETNHHNNAVSNSSNSNNYVVSNSGNNNSNSANNDNESMSSSNPTRTGFIKNGNKTRNIHHPITAAAIQSNIRQLNLGGGARSSPSTNQRPWSYLNNNVLDDLGSEGAGFVSRSQPTQPTLQREVFMDNIVLPSTPGPSEMGSTNLPQQSRLVWASATRTYDQGGRGGGSGLRGGVWDGVGGGREEVGGGWGGVKGEVIGSPTSDSGMSSEDLSPVRLHRDSPLAGINAIYNNNNDHGNENDNNDSSNNNDHNSGNNDHNIDSYSSSNDGHYDRV